MFLFIESNIKIQNANIGIQCIWKSQFDEILSKPQKMLLTHFGSSQAWLAVKGLTVNLLAVSWKKVFILICTCQYRFI